MGLQDLTPQLRTRLSRVERAVGLFVMLATFLLLAGFSYYFYYTADRKGWFKTKAPFFTYVKNATGLGVGAPVKMMGFDVGQITRITAEDPGKDYNVYVEFYVQGEYIGYVWNDSRVKVIAADFLGGRNLEILQGGWNGYTNANGTKKDLHAVYEQKGKTLTAVWLDQEGRYERITKDSKPYWLLSDESPAVTERLERLVDTAEKALPNFLTLTNQLTTILDNTARVSANADELVDEARPIVTNLAAISERLKDPRGSLGEWLIPTNINTELEKTLVSANSLLTNSSRTLTNVDNTLLVASNAIKTADATLASAQTVVTNADEHLAVLVSNLNRTLDNIANMTSNLNSQVQANSNIVTEISDAIVHADELMQGLKRHWLLRSAFKEKKTNQPPPKSTTPPLGPPRRY
ncbi:MAG: MlaD family protein [Verrucomicrobiota bacterium]